ncbi:MAG: hypothetical protein WCT77_00265 [Bacteroidota bacterium]|jgi:hypothetical protein
MTDNVSIVRLHSLKNGNIYHWGILVEKPDGDEYIYHNMYDRKNKLGGNIVKENYSDFKKQGYFLFDKTPIPLTEEQVIEKSKPLLRQKWDLAYFSCRDYVKRIYSKLPEGQEKLIVWGIGAGLVILTVGIIIGVNIYRKNKNK